ncbi:MAG TPA: DUF4760 domain-containing protein [Pyrinomonadaceae bacterium]|jgi:hypothetical protein
MSGQVGEIGSVRVKLTVFIILAIVSVLVVVIHILAPAYRGEIEFATAVAGGAAVVYAGYYTAISLRISIDQNKKNNAFKLLSELNDVDLVKIRTLVEKEIPAENLTRKQMHDKILNDQILLAGVTNILGIFEDLAIAIQHDQVDEEVLHASLVFLIPWTFDKLKPYIDEERREAQVLYCEMEKLRDAWRAQRYLRTGERISG